MKKKLILTIACIIVIVLGACLWGISAHRSVTLSDPVLMDKVGPMTRSERKMISNLIVKTIQDGLDGKERSYPDLNAYPPKWRAMKTVYTTLNIGNKLRGCLGNQNNPKPLLYAIVDSAYAAAFNDPRFPKLTQEEFDNPDFNYYISVFGEEKPLTFLNEQDIIRQLKPLQQGAILIYQSENGEEKRGLFLPSVWKKNPTPEQFWEKLKKKAGLKKNFFSNQFKVLVFPAETIRNLDFVMRQDAQRIQTALTAYQMLFRPNGHITYEINFKTGKSSDKKNLVREMGSGYGLAHAYYLNHDSELQPILERFLGYISSITVPYQNGVLVADNPKKISAGASALALLAVLYYEQESQDVTFQQLRQDLKNGLIALFEPNVGIHRSPTETETSPYYDGETWLALVMYHAFHPEDKELAKLMPTLNKTMYDKYANEYLYNFFHWGTQAAANYLAKTDDPLMYDFLKKQLNIYIDTVDYRAGSSSCSYAEGLAESALALRKKDKLLYQKTLTRLEDQLEVARLLQDIPFKKQKKGEIAENMAPLLGLFLNTSDSLKTRNDITQHCLSALMKAQRVFQDAP